MGLDLELPPMEGASADSAPDELSLDLDIATATEPEQRQKPPSILDLEMPSRPAPRSRLQQATHVRPSEASAGDALDGDDIDRDNIGFADSVVMEQGYQSATARGEPWPTGRTPHGDTLAIDEVEVRLASGFGKVPDNLLREPEYSWKVFMGRRKLDKELVDRKKAVTDAESERDKTLIQLVDSVRDHIEKDNRLERILEKVKRLESKARQRTTKLNAVGEKYRKDSAEIQAELAEIAAQMAKSGALLQRSQVELDHRLETYKRADAKYKRIQIEGRNLKAADDRAAAEGKPRSNEAKLAQLSQMASAQAKALRAPLTAVKEAERAVTGIKSRMKDLEKQTSSARKRLEVVEKTYAEQFDLRTESLSDDAREHLMALADAGRSLLECQGQVEIEPSLIEKVRVADELVMERLTIYETTLRAIESFDRDAYKRGIVIAGIAGGLIFLVLILWVISPGEPAATFDDEKYESRLGVADGSFG